MERIVRTLGVDGHVVAVVESMDEDGTCFLVSVDSVVINPDAPLARPPSDEVVEAAARRFRAGA